VQVIDTIFEQQPGAELLPAALEHNVGILVRVVFDEGILTGKYTVNSAFPEGDSRKNDFAGDRLARRQAC
jgi:aryl-alcohol dehydrogenase-like predicted oxidoreductase